MKDSIQEWDWLQRFMTRNGIVYRPPAVHAKMVALQSRRHLHTAVAGDAVKVVLVALVTTTQAAIEPETGLDCPRAHEMVALLGEGLNSLILKFHAKI
jgi:hypothetical protein